MENAGLVSGGLARLRVGSVDLDYVRIGSGPSLLYLDDAFGTAPSAETLAILGEKFSVIAPHHPGFGTSPLPNWITSTDDYAYLYLALLDALGEESVFIAGVSLGSWIALQMAIKCPERFTGFILASPIGVKTGSRDALDIPDIYAMTYEALSALLYHDPATVPDRAECDEEELVALARNEESFALLSWEPYMHDPKLPHRLNRVRQPVVLVRGASDGLLTDSYVQSLSRLLPNSSVKTLDSAGHRIQVDQPVAFGAMIADFACNLETPVASA